MMTPYHAYSWLETKRQWRNRDALIFRLALPTAVYLIQTLVSGDAGGGSSTGSETNAGVGTMVAIAALGAVISGLAAGPSLGEERANGWLRQLRVTPLRPIAVVAAKIVAAMSFALSSIALVATAAGVTENVSLDAVRWITVIGLMWIATAPITALGVLIGLTFAAEAANGATTLAFVVLWLLGGIFTSPNNMPDTLAAITRTLPSYGVFEVGWSAASGDPLPTSAVLVLAAWTVGAGMLAALAWRRVVTR